MQLSKCVLFLGLITGSLGCSDSVSTISGGDLNPVTSSKVSWQNLTRAMVRTYGLSASTSAKPSFQFIGKRVHVFYKCFFTSAISTTGTCSFDDLYGQSFNDWDGMLMPSLLSPTPNLNSGANPFGYIKVNAAVGWTSVASSAMSKAVPRPDLSGAYSIAQFLYNPSNSGEAPKLVVLEGIAPQIRTRYVPGTATENQATWTAEWAMVGGSNIGTFAAGDAVYRGKQLSLLSGNVTEINNQNSTKPYIVSAVGNSNDHKIFYFNNSSSWSSISTSGFSSNASNLIGQSLIRSADGALYGCNVAQVNTPSVHYEGEIVKYNGSTWDTVYTLTDVYMASSVEYKPCQMVAKSNGGIYVVFVQETGALKVLSVSGSSVSAVNTTNVDKVSELWDLKMNSGSLYLAIQKLFEPSAEGDNAFSGPTQALLKYDGSSFSTVTSVVGYPSPFLDESSPSIDGIEIDSDFKGIIAMISQSFFPDGSFPTSKQYISIWQAR